MNWLLQIIRNPIFSATGLRILALTIGLVGSVLISRLGGPELKGIFSAFTAANAIVFMLWNFDLPQQALREGRRVEDQKIVSAVLAKGWLVYTVFGVLTLTSVLLVGSSVWWVLLGAVCFTFVTQTGVAAVGLNGAFVGALGALIQQIGLTVIVCLFWYLDNLNETTIKVTAMLSYLVPVLFYLPLIFVKSSNRPSVPWKRVGALIVKGIPWQLGRLMQMLMQRMDVVIIAAFLGAASAGVYSVGLSTAMLCTIMPAQISNQVLYEASRDTSGQYQIRRQFKFALIAGAVPAGVLALIGEPLITLVYGPDFSAAYETLLWSLPGAIAYGILQVQTNFIRLRGGWKPFWYMGLIGVLVMSALILLLVPYMGEPGAAVAFSGASIVSVAFGFRLFRKIFSENQF